MHKINARNFVQEYCCSNISTVCKDPLCNLLLHSLVYKEMLFYRPGPCLQNEIWSRWVQHVVRSMQVFKWLKFVFLRFTAISETRNVLIELEQCSSCTQTLNSSKSNFNFIKPNFLLLLIFPYRRISLLSLLQSPIFHSRPQHATAGSNQVIHCNLDFSYLIIKSLFT